MQQHPRYVAARKNTPVHFVCYSKDAASMQWYKTTEDSKDFDDLDRNTSRYSIERKGNLINLTIFRIAYEDNGIYVCDSKNLTAEKRLHSCGTELRVMSEWELPILHTPQEMLFLFLSPFPPPCEPYAPTSPHAGGTPSDPAEDAPWHSLLVVSQAAGQPPPVCPGMSTLQEHPRHCMSLTNQIFSWVLPKVPLAPAGSSRGSSQCSGLFQGLGHVTPVPAICSC